MAEHLPVILNIPNSARYQVKIDPLLSWGEDTAVVTLHVYSDFYCDSECENLVDAFNNIRNRFGNKVRWVYHALPNREDWVDDQTEWAERVYCVAEQKHLDLLRDIFEGSREIAVLDNVDELIQAGIDNVSYQACLSSRQTREHVLTQQKEIEQFSLTGYPLLIVNGVSIDVSSSMHYLIPLIEQEIAASKKN